MLMTIKILFIPESTEGVDGEVETTKREKHEIHSREEVEQILK